MIPAWTPRRRAHRARERALHTLATIGKRGNPVVAGPWVAGVGYELLYWIPLLRWLTTEGGVPRERILAIARGGADSWYADVSVGYLDVLDKYTVGEVKRWSRGQLDKGPQGVDRDVFRRAAALADSRKVEWLHPSIVHKLFAPRRQFGASASLVAGNTVHRLLPPGPDVSSLGLHEPYTAVRISFSECFPNTPENRALVERAIAVLAERTQVVLLRAQDESLGEQPYTPSDSLPVVDLFDHLAPRHSLGIQSSVIRGARAYFTTYGGTAFIGPYVGTPTLAVYSHAKFNLADLDAMDRVGRRLTEGTQLFRARHAGSLRTITTLLSSE